MASWPQMCWLCNVKLISEPVAKSHFSGKKHNDKFKALTTGSRDDQTMTAGVSHPRGDDVVITEPWCYESYENIFMAGSMARSLTVSQRSLNECGISSVNRNKKYHKTEGQLARSRSNSHLSENIGRNQGGAEEDVQRPEVSVAHRGRGRGQGRGGQRGRGGKSFNKDNRQLQPARCQKNNEEFDQEDGEQWSQGGAEEDVQRPEVSVAHRGRGRGQGRGGQRGRGGKSLNKDNRQLQPARCQENNEEFDQEDGEQWSQGGAEEDVQRPEVSVAHRGRGRGQGRGGQRGRGGKSFNKDNRQLQPARCQENNEEFDQEDGEQWSQGGAEEDVQRPEVSVAHRGRGRGQGRGGQRGRGGKSLNKDNRQLQPARCQENNEEFDQEDGEQWSQGGAEEDVQRPEVSVAHRGRGRGQGRGGQRGRGGKSFNKDNTQLQPARCKKSDQSSGNEFQEELSKESIRAAVQEYMKKHPNATSQDMNDVIMHVKRILQSEKSKQHPESRCSDGSSQSNKPESIKCDKTEGKPVQQQHPHIKCTSTKKELGKAKPAESAVDENAIFQYVVKKFSGRCTVKDIQCEMEYMFPPDTTILDWLLKSRSFKVFKSRDSSKLDESLVIVEMYSLKRCIYYTETDCCEYKNCPYVHICQDFLAGCCSDVTCPLSHDLEDEHNIAVFKNLKLCDSFTPEEILTLLRCCTLRVCSDWNNNQKCSLLTKYALCPDMHVCTEFLLGKCTENKCKLGHDFSASGQKLLLQLYSLTKIPEGLLKKAILLPIERNDAICGRRPNHQNEEGSIIKEEAHADKTEFYQEELSEVEELPLENQNQIHLYCDDDDRYICEANLNNQCSTNPKVCGRHHYPSTYLWQIKVDGVWQTSTENDSIEEKYCDPSIDSYIYFMDYHGSKRVTKIDFTRLQCRDDDYIKLYPVRRLTTESYVNGSKNDSKKTVWIWYWEDDSQYWNSYSFDSFPYQDVLEAKYLAHEKACIFMIGHNQYLIQFDEMTQTNIITQKKRNIRRRPLKSQNCPYILHFDRMALPKDADWAPMNTELITVPDLNLLSSSSAKYEMVAAKFFETLDRNKYEIVRIVQVQNLVLWDRYQRKKYVMQQCPYLKNDVKEMFLFHGTPSLDVVRCICKDGFDWRVCGKHGTAYGNGSYFAKDASYSNNYSRADHSGKQYMFLSRVLVGLYAKGSANLTRPPQLDISKPDGDRYHSCVNHLNNPTIFVVFHDDQSYPEYLIEYHELDNQTYLSLIRQRYSTTTSTQRQQPQHLTLASAPIQQQQQQKQQHSTPTSTQEQQPQHLTLYSAPIQQQQQQKQQHSTPTSTQQQQQPQHLTLASAPIQQQQQKQQHSTPTSTQQQQPQHLTLASAPIEKQQQQQSTPKSCIVM